MDTNVIRIHEVNEGCRNRHIWNQLFNDKKGRSTYESTITFEPKTELKKNEFGYTISNYLQLNELHINDSNKSFRKYRGSIYVKSSSYFLNFFYDPENNFIEFNFSVPKFIYGTNLVQFVRHRNENFYGPLFYLPDQIKMASNYFETMYDRYIIFLDYLFHSLFVDSVDYRYVEIRRFDLCFNLIFKSKQDAMIWLSYVKRMVKKHQRVLTNKNVPYLTGQWIQNDDYVAKIYHKGTEYMVPPARGVCGGEKFHHKKINRESKKFNRIKYDIFTIDSIYKDGVLIKEGLQEFADRIMRFEIEFSNKYMSRIFNTKLYHKKDYEFQYMKHCYNLVDAAENKYQRWEDKQTLSNFRNKYHMKTEKLNMRKDIFLNISDLQIKKAALYKKLISVNKQFFLKASKVNKIRDDNMDYEKYIDVKFFNYPFERKVDFSKELFNECSKIFIDFVNEFYLNKRIDVSSFLDKVDQFNKNANHKMRKPDMRKMFDLLKNSSMDELIQNEVIERHQKARWNKKLKLLDMKPGDIMKQSLEIAYDFSAYHDYVDSNQSAVQYQLNNSVFK